MSARTASDPDLPVLWLLMMHAENEVVGLRLSGGAAVRPARQSQLGAPPILAQARFWLASTGCSAEHATPICVRQPALFLAVVRRRGSSEMAFARPFFVLPRRLAGSMVSSRRLPCREGAVRVVPLRGGPSKDRSRWLAWVNALRACPGGRVSSPPARTLPRRWTAVSPARGLVWHVRSCVFQAWVHLR